MKVKYKNKRDFYKAQSEMFEMQAKMWKEKVEELRKEDTDKKITVSWFCTQCRVVGTGSLKYNVNVENCNCPSCGANKLLAVGKMPFPFIN